jgi:protein SCO1/2
MMLLRNAIFACTLAFAPVVPGLAQDDVHQYMEMDAVAPIPGKSIYNLEETWTNQDGVSAPLSSLRGKLIVAAMGYTICKDMCPAIVADMLWIEKHLKPESIKRVRFVFFSFDSKVDTPERLSLYAQGHGFDLERWTLFNGDENAVRQLAAALDVRYRPDGQGGFDHSAVISLLDAEGNIAFQQIGAQASSKEFVEALEGMLTRGM